MVGVPAMGINVIVSCVLAFSSIMICEKCDGLKLASLNALAKFPETANVQTTTLNPYNSFKLGIGKLFRHQFEYGIRSLSTFRLLYAEVYSRNISLVSKNGVKRSAISSHTAFELAQTSTLFSPDDLIMPSMAATSVRVFPVPITIKIKLVNEYNNNECYDNVKKMK